MEEKKEIELNSFDCEEFLKIIQEREVNNRKLERLSGEIRRKNRIIEGLLDRDEELAVEAESKKKQLEERYELDENYSWSLDLDNYMARGILKEDPE